MALWNGCPAWRSVTCVRRVSRRSLDRVACRTAHDERDVSAGLAACPRDGVIDPKGQQRSFVVNPDVRSGQDLEVVRENGLRRRRNIYFLEIEHRDCHG